MFDEATTGQTNLACKIAGNLLGASTGINMDPKNKQNVEANLKKMGNTFQLIQKKKDIAQAVHSLSLTSENQQVEAILEG